MYVLILLLVSNESSSFSLQYYTLSLTTLSSRSLPLMRNETSITENIVESTKWIVAIPRDKYCRLYRVSQLTWKFSDEFDIVFLNNSLI